MPKYKFHKCYVNRLSWIVEAENEQQALEIGEDKSCHEAEDEDEYLGCLNQYTAFELDDQVELLEEENA